MPNRPETVVAFLACASIGAIWSSCSPDFGWRGVIDRFTQLTPKVLFCVDGYRYGGQEFHRTAEMGEIIGALGSLEHVIYLPYLEPDRAQPPAPGALTWAAALDHPAVPAAQFHFEQVPFDHPLWILFSSGTTGPPKPIMHGHGGILLHHHRLDDVELPGQLAAARGVPGALRRQSWVSRARRPVAGGPGRGRQLLRRQPGLRRPHVEVRRRAGRAF
jgi:acetoacetyl-CoA synthetase